MEPEGQAGQSATTGFTQSPFAEMSTSLMGTFTWFADDSPSFQSLLFEYDD